MNDSALTDLDNNNDDGFVDIDEFLGTQQEIITVSIKPKSSGITEKVNGGTLGGSPTNSTHSTEGSS